MRIAMLQQSGRPWESYCRCEYENCSWGLLATTLAAILLEHWVVASTPTNDVATVGPRSAAFYLIVPGECRQ